MNTELMKLREEADCNPAYFFIAEDFSGFSREAEDLCGQTRKYLKEKKYL